MSSFLAFFFAWLQSRRKCKKYSIQKTYSPLLQISFQLIYRHESLRNLIFNLYIIWTFWLEKDIEQAITDMRTWKRVLDDDSLEAVWDDIEANSSEIDDVLKDME